ncbi:MAG: ankyrin repeat domain-containing protein [Treponema sp.]|jgi:hypothetical protein|nr:ankyrin repeat domain-containing protein [Treponema sp.]
MKIIFIYTEEETEAAEWFTLFLEKKDISAEPLSLRTTEYGDIKKQFASFFAPADSEEENSAPSAAPSHVFIITPIVERWVDFLAGFAYGSRLPVLFYGEKAIECIPVEFTSFFRALKSESSLQDYIDAEREASVKWEAARKIVKAREALLQMGIPVTGEALANCAAKGSVQELTLFLEAGFSPDTRDKAGVPLLNLCARKGNMAIFELLIQSGAQLNLQADDRGTSALIESVMRKQYSMVEDLIKAGADLNIKSKDGQTALVVAAGSSDEKMVELLLKAGADPDIPDSLGVSARKYASLFRNSAILDLFDTLAPLQ